MQTPVLKVCGLVRPEDAQMAEEAGATALGFVCVPGTPRHLEAAAVAAILASVQPAATAVLVLADRGPAEARELCARAGTSRVQLCGRERPADFRAFPFPIWRRLGVGEGARAELEAWRTVAEAFVLDHPSAPGGTGLPVDPALAAELARLAPCILAGGLDAAEVARRVPLVQPAGVDASSRLESSPGVKDPARVRAYLAAARVAFALNPSPGARP